MKSRDRKIKKARTASTFRAANEAFTTFSSSSYLFSPGLKPPRGRATRTTTTEFDLSDSTPFFAA
jgi:hypothetical protein